MRILAVLVLAGCSHTVVDDFTVVTPAAEVRALAGKTAPQIHGLSCRSICTTGREYKAINYCTISTLDVNPRLVCRLRRSGGIAPGYGYEVLVDVPVGVSVPASGSVPTELCERAGCKGKMAAEDVPVVDECSVYPYHPDETEQFLVCSFREEREINGFMQ